MKFRRKVYRYKVVPLGINFFDVARSIGYQREQGWTLVSTYMDKNRSTIHPTQMVCGVFETWEKK
jgi:hypothetical protein